MEKLKILIGCEFTGTVRDAFEKKGHDVWSCDILPTESEQTRKEGKHIQGDLLKVLDRGWDLFIGHPPCTYITNSGVRWLHTEKGRWDKMVEACIFFKALLDADIKMIAIENPIPHGHAVKLIGRKYDQLIQPWQFGHGETKATCLWLKNLPHLNHTNIVEGREQRIWKMSPGPNRQKERSKFYTGFAEAMANQWSQSKAVQLSLL